jgi:type II secretory pathway pseudopilin PulG
MRQRGFTYILLLWWVAISGVLLAALGQQWLMESRRQRETELVFRGTQIGRALGSYREVTPAGKDDAPMSMDELLEDKRGPVLVRHLRQLWPDPITGKPWVVEWANGRIQGVHSASQAKPIRAGDGIERYEQWRFDGSVWQAATPASAAEAPPLQPAAPQPVRTRR